MTALAFAVALAIMGRSAAADDAACRSGEPDSEASSLLQAQKVRTSAALASGGSCKTRNCGCGPYTDMGPQTSCAYYDMGPYCSQSETQCSICHGTWCPGSADDSRDPTPTPAPAVGGSSGGGECKPPSGCGCPPYAGSRLHCAYQTMGPHCSQSETQCSICNGTWCPGSADDSSDPTPATPTAPAVGGSSSGGGECKPPSGCGCPPYAGSRLHCAYQTMGPHCSQSETQCSICNGTWCPGSADDSSDPTPASPTPAPAVGGSSGGGGECKPPSGCGCPPYAGSQLHCAYQTMGPHCSQSETECSICHGTWCPASSTPETLGTNAGAQRAVATATAATALCGALLLF